MASHTSSHTQERLSLHNPQWPGPLLHLSDA